MPNQFGLETTQEAQQRIAQGYADRRDSFLDSKAAENDASRLGWQIGDLLGRSFRKGRETKAARRTEAQRLAEDEGLSIEEARRVAKESVPREFSEVRRAKKMAEGQGIAERTFAQLAPVIGETKARAASMTVMAAQLRRNGFASEATKLTMKSLEIRQMEELRLLKLDELKTEVQGKKLTNDNIGESEFTNLDDDLEELTAQIEVSDDPREIAELERRKERATGRMTMLTTRVGRTEFDPGPSKGTQDKIQLDILDSKLLDERFGMLEEMIGTHKGNLSSTTIGRYGANVAAGLEGMFGLDPGTYGADTLVEDVSEFKSFPAFAASQLRHALTGAAMSAQEAPMMEPFLPTPGDSVTVMLGKIAAVRAYTQLDIKVRQDFARAWNTDGIIPPALEALMQANQKAAVSSRAAAMNSGVENGQVKVPLNAHVQAAIDAANRN